MADPKRWHAVNTGDVSTQQTIAEWLCRYDQVGPFEDLNERDQDWYTDQADDLIRHIYT